MSAFAPVRLHDALERDVAHVETRGRCAGVEEEAAAIHPEDEMQRDIGCDPDPPLDVDAATERRTPDVEVGAAGHSPQDRGVERGPVRTFLDRDVAIDRVERIEPQSQFGGAKRRDLRQRQP